MMLLLLSLLLSLLLTGQFPYSLALRAAHIEILFVQMLHNDDFRFS